MFGLKLAERNAFWARGALVLMVFVFAGVATDMDAATVKSSLTLVESVKATQAKALQRAGIANLDQLAVASTAKVAKALRISNTAAASIVKEAKTRQQRLRAVYSTARSRYVIKQPPWREDLVQQRLLAEYAALIAPTNECTILVRKVCGSENQCANRPGCPSAKELLSRYNQETDKTDLTYSCLAALENAIVFAECDN